MLPKLKRHKVCCSYCGPERCDCEAGQPWNEWVGLPKEVLVSGPCTAHDAFSTKTLEDGDQYLP